MSLAFEIALSLILSLALSLALRHILSHVSRPISSHILSHVLSLALSLILFLYNRKGRRLLQGKALISSSKEKALKTFPLSHGRYSFVAMPGLCCKGRH